MASFLSNLLAGLTPPPHINPVQYDGIEYKWSIFVFRPALFQHELYLLAGVFVYIVFVTIGVSRNSSKVNKWHVIVPQFNAHRPILEKQFSKPLGKSGLTKDGYSDFFNFSTGRRNVMSLHTVFALQPRHDLFQWLYQFGRTLIDLHYRPKDDVTLDFKLSASALNQDFVWAVVAKDELLSIKEDRWDLEQTFTKTSENSNLPPTLSVMSEFADVTDNLLKPALVAALNDPKVLPYFRSLSVTDQPRIRPEAPLPASSRQKHVILSLSLPSDRVEDTGGLVSVVFPFIDALSTVNLRPETRTKLKKTREELDKTLKADADKEKKEELSQAAEDKKAAKRRAEEERIAKLPAAEQQKILEKERKRAMRKTQGKAVVRK
ncbi:hypothetical protein D9615_000427 [Tricholomella constricta]|uniref:DUF1682-domain-containing protein n=1 Tax=Tricholomella constricta TaxID=117010 RepID=A0A8H5HRH4_9AGAR|nr:hypothetical protein D9615_000427 [Tricholomella constricta]